MWRKLFLIGACVFLLAAKTDGVKRKNEQKFWELWDSDTANDGPGNPENHEDFTIDGEGSGDNDIYMHGHEDDEDFDVISGEGEPEETIEHETHPKITTDDEDEIFGSGSGEEPANPEVDPVIPVVVEIPEQTTVPKSKLSKCESLRDSAVGLYGYKADCEKNGDFKRMQCKVDGETKLRSCWCVFNNGSRIDGTLMEDPKVPDCVAGTNLGCFFTRVQNADNLINAILPRCKSNGDYEPEQCSDDQCWCVDKYGNQVLGSVVTKPKQANCAMGGLKNSEPTTKTPIKDLPVGGGYTVAPGKEDKDKVIVTDIVLGNTNSNFQEYEPVKHESNIIQQPGFLAAIIAGGVITLLLVVLLVMFIVYRMRKKDEGSYPLDEQKFQNYSYSKAPDKEFYA